MAIRILALAAGLLASHAATAGEPSVARIVEVRGNVLVSNGYEMASATEALRVAADTRLLAIGNASAVVEFGDGCRVRLQPGTRLEIRRESPCSPPAAGVVAHAVVSERRP